MNNVYRLTDKKDKLTKSLIENDTQAGKPEAIGGHFIYGSAHRKIIAKYCFFILLNYKIY